jgi:predicted DNA-binding ribbon-helix-helix protein
MSTIVKRSIAIGSKKTSVSLEDEFWHGLRTIAQMRKTPVADIVKLIKAERGRGNLSSAIRVYVLGYYREKNIK